jgi:Tfp pilus assembly PilM family ATPase
LQSTVIGSQKELVLVRSIDYGGKALTHALTANGAVDAATARVMIQKAMPDDRAANIARPTGDRSARFDRFSKDNTNKHSSSFVSGGLARTETVLQTLSDELGLPCEIWDPLETCEVALPPAKRQALPSEFVSLNVACGAAFEYLRN